MGAEVQVLVSGRGLVEAPRWHDGRLYFSDWTTGEVVAADTAGHTEGCQ
jgi:sugar lactone lactonase YvrE